MLHSKPRPLLLSSLALLSAACGGDARATAGRWEGTMDTLPNGAVLVSNPAQGIWKPGEEWRLVEELRIGSADVEGPELFGEIIALEVDRLGRIYVLDRQAKEVRVFDPDGRHVRSFGRKGGGPGEFKDPIGLAWHPEGTLWVADPANTRYSVHDTTGTFLATHRRALGGYGIPWNGGLDAEGRMHEVSYLPAADGRSRPVLLRFDREMAAADTFPLPDFRGEEFRHRTDRSATFVAVPFASRMSRRVYPGYGVWSGVSDRYRIHHQSLEGDTLRAVERELEPVSVTPAEKDEALASLKWFTDRGGRIDPSRIPSRKPAFTDLSRDDSGYLWVQPSLPADTEGSVLDVFDPEGRYLGVVRSGIALGSFPPMLVRGDRLYAVVRDELEVPYVVRYRIEGRAAER